MLAIVCVCVCVSGHVSKGLPSSLLHPVAPLTAAEISTSKERSFAAVDFVDTPGLVDGDMKVGFFLWRDNRQTAS